MDKLNVTAGELLQYQVQSNQKTIVITIIIRIKEILTAIVISPQYPFPIQSDIMGWRLDLIINKLTPPAAAEQHVYYCDNCNG